jgi:hypothetical protein
MKPGYFGFLMGLMFMACVKTDNLPLGQTNNSNLVIEGGVNRLGTFHALRISQVSTSTLTNPLPVSHLIVRVIGGGDILNFSESAIPGVYTCDLGHKLKLNQRYVLSAISEDQSHQIYAFDTLYRVIPIKGSSIPYSFSTLKSGKIEVQIPKHEFGQKNCLKWLLVPKSGNLWDPKLFNQTFPYTYFHQLGAPNVLYTLNSVTTVQDFNPSDSVAIYKFSLSSTHGIYLYSIFEETDWKGLFSGAPSQVIGNISLNGQGFFSAMDVDTRTYAVKDLLGKKTFF